MSFFVNRCHNGAYYLTEYQNILLLFLVPMIF